MAKLPKTLGFGMGLEFRESANVLSATNTTPLQAGMVLNVAIGAPHPRRPVWLRGPWPVKPPATVLHLADAYAMHAVYGVCHGRKFRRGQSSVCSCDLYCPLNASSCATATAGSCRPMRWCPGFRTLCKTSSVVDRVAQEEGEG